MIVRLGDVTYRVRFGHSMRGGHVIEGGKVVKRATRSELRRARRLTTAFIDVSQVGTTTDTGTHYRWSPLYQATVRHHPHDPCSREQGMRMALVKVLTAMFPYLPEQSVEEKLQQRKYRKVFFTLFDNRRVPTQRMVLSIEERDMIAAQLLDSFTEHFEHDDQIDGDPIRWQKLAARFDVKHPQLDALASDLRAELDAHMEHSMTDAAETAT